MDKLLQKSELVHMTWKVAQKDVPGLKKAHIEAILDGLVSSITDALAEGREVPLGKMCKISVRQYPPKTIEDRHTGKPRELPSRKMLFITTCKQMFGLLNARKQEQPADSNES